MKRRMGRGGFTLIELLVVSAVLGILAGVAVPQLSRAIDRAAASKVVADARNLQLGVRTFLEAGGTLPASSDWGVAPTGLAGYVEGGISFTFRDATYRFVTQPTIDNAQLWVGYPLGSPLGSALMKHRNETTITWTPTRTTFILVD